MKTFLRRFVHVLAGTIAALAVATVVAGCGGDDSSSHGESSDSTSNSESEPASPTPTSTPTPTPTKASSPLEEAREALGDDVDSDFAVGESDVRSVERMGGLLYIVLETPEGGMDGPSTDDADALASAAWAEVYPAGWNGPSTVQFRGGLQDSRTGMALPDAVAFTYRIEPRFARQIDWSNEDTLYSIDWGLYRTYCHPAFKGC